MNRKVLSIITLAYLSIFNLYSQAIDTLKIDEITVVSFYRNNSKIGDVVGPKDLLDGNYGQEPSHVFSQMPSVFAYSDNGTDFGYGYFRIRGLDQTRINVTLDGCPWNEAEDFGTYFANSPDLMSSMKTIKVEKGGNTANNGIAGSAGSINMESLNLYEYNPSYVHLSGGSWGTLKGSIVYNMPSDGKWGLHLKATHQQTDGYRDFGFNKSEALTVKFGYKINSKHSIDFLTMNGFHRNGQGWLGNTIEELKINPRANGCTEVEDDNWLMSMNRIQYKGVLSDNIILTSSVYGQFQTGSYRMDLDNYNRRMIDPQSSETGKVYDYGLNHNMIGANTFAKFYFRKITFTTGFNVYTYRRNHYMADKCVNIPEEEYYSNYGRKTDLSYLANVVYKPWRKVSIGANVQYRGVFFRYKDTDKYGNPSIDNASVSKDWNFVNFGVNADYNPWDFMRIYGRFTYLNREPTRSDMFGGNEWFLGEIATTTPEISKDFEFGFDWTANDRFQANLNFFYMWFDNELILNGEYGLNGLPVHENAISSYRRGIELSLDWNIVSKLYYKLNGSLSQNHVKSATFGNRTHVMSPGATMFTEIAWKAHMWELGINAEYRDGMFVDMENLYRIPYMLSAGAYVKTKIKDIEVSLMFDGIPFYKRPDFCNGMIGANGKLLLVQDAPHTMIFTVRYYF